ncbi:MAG: LPS export ABC transporter periplasmic protein LptC [Flavipsychrobacter sp.]
MIKLNNNIYNTITRMILLPGILFCLASCKNDPKEIEALVSQKQLQQDRAEDVTIIYSEQGKAKVRLQAKTFIRNDVAMPPYTEMDDGLKVEFFNDSLAVESTLTAIYARYYEKKGNILIRDSVVVVNKKGDELHTEELVWNQKAKKIYTDKFVRIITPTQIMYGNGLEANEDFSWYRIVKPKGIVKVEKEKMPE